MPRKPNEAQLAFNRRGAGAMRQDGVRRAQQIVKQRTFTYDGSLRPTCLTCGSPRENRKALRCNRCGT